MDAKSLNLRKKEILNAQQDLLTKASAEKMVSSRLSEDEMFS
jgi:hypothetical protein